MVMKILSKTKYLPLIIAFLFVGGMIVTKQIQDKFHNYSNVISLLDDIKEMDMRRHDLSDNKGYNHRTRELESFKPERTKNNTDSKKNIKNIRMSRSNESIDFKLRNKGTLHILDFVAHRNNHPRKNSCLNNIKSNGYTYTCRQNKLKNTAATLVMFTTIYGNIDHNKYLFINNTLTFWANLKPKLIPVLFLVPNVQYMEVMKYLSKTACSLGWDVQIAPECHEGLPVLRTMFEVVSPLYEASWYGYAENGVLFDQSVISAMDKLQWYNKKIKPYGLLAGDSRRLQISEEADLVHSYKYILSLHDKIDYKTNPTTGPSYFIIKKNGFPWSQFPKIVVGQPHLNTYLLWFTHYHKRIFEIDVTGAIFAVEQTIVAEDDTQTTEIYSEDKHFNNNKKISNSSFHILNNKTLTYNEQLIVNRTYNSDEFMNNIQYVKEKGTTKCLSHKLGHINSPYIKLFKRFTTFVPAHDPSYPCVINKYTLVRPDTEEYDEFLMS